MRTPIVAVLVLLVTFALGAWLGGRIEHMSGEAHVESTALLEPAPVPVGSGAAHAETLAQALLEEVRGLRAELASAPPERSAREPALSTDKEVGALAEAVQQLANALRSAAIVPAGSMAHEGPGGERIPPLVHSLANGYQSSTALFAADDKSLHEAHFGWSLQQIIDRYGVPDKARALQRGVEVSYWGGRGTGSECWVVFELSGDFVLNTRGCKD